MYDPSGQRELKSNSEESVYLGQVGLIEMCH